MEPFPPNSDRSRRETQEEKKVERVTTGDASRRKKPLRRQFREVFFGADGKTTLNYVMFGVMIPAAKDMIIDATTEGVSRLLRGDSARYRSRPTGATGYVAYNRMTSMSDKPPTPIMSRRARVRHDFDEIILSSRLEADEVVDRLFDLLSRYGNATVADLYELTGIEATHVDQKWGWTELRGAGVTRIRNGYLLDLPEPVPLP